MALSRQHIQFLEAATDVTGWSKAGKTIHARKCTLIPVKSAQYPDLLLIKTYRADSIKNTGTLHQAEALAKNTGTARSPGLIASSFETRSFIQTRIDGPALADILKRRTSQVNISINAAGVWLRLYHDSYPVQKALFKPFRFFQPLTRQKPVRTARALYYDSFINPVTTHLKSQRGQNIPVGTIHGDFTPSNIIITQDIQPVGIDLWGEEDKYLWRDLIRMISYLTSDHARTLPDCFSALLHQSYVKAFLDGYQFAPENEELFLTVLASEYMRRLMRTDARIAHNPFDLKARRRRARLKAYTALYMAEFHEKSTST